MTARLERRQSKPRLLKPGVYNQKEALSLLHGTQSFLAYTWDGNCFEVEGVEPDHTVELPRDAMRSGRDDQLEGAIELTRSVWLSAFQKRGPITH